MSEDNAVGVSVGTVDIVTTDPYVKVETAIVADIEEARSIVDEIVEFAEEVKKEVVEFVEGVIEKF